MRWQQLFDDLEARLELLERQERAADVAEHTRAERGQVELAQRLVADHEQEVRVRVAGVGWLPGRLSDVGTDWMTLVGASQPQGRGADLLIPLAAVSAVEGLTGRADAATGVASRRFGLRHALRAVSRDRAIVRIHDRAGDHVTGTIDRVLADHLDLTRHPDVEDRRVRVRSVLTLPYPSLSLVRRL